MLVDSPGVSFKVISRASLEDLKAAFGFCIIPLPASCKDRYDFGEYINGLFIC